MKRFCLSALAFILMLALAACGAADLESTEEATVTEDGVRIALYEDQALPYRWSLAIDSEVLYLESDQRMDGYDFPLAAGEASSSRVFTLRFTGDGSGCVTLSCSRIEPEDPGDIIDERAYLIEKNGDVITLTAEATVE